MQWQTHTRKSQHFEAELNSYGQGGRVLGPVVGAFGEMSDDVKELANAVAEELAVEHCSFYGDKTSKAVKGFFLNQIYRSWGHTAHRGWARLLLDRRSLVQVPNAPRRRARADDRYYEENIMESYQSVEYPQWVISIQRTKANCHVFPFSSLQPNCPWLRPLSLVLWVLYLLS